MGIIRNSRVAPVPFLVAFGIEIVARHVDLHAVDRAFIELPVETLQGFPFREAGLDAALNPEPLT